jgi:hypothetical protein
MPLGSREGVRKSETASVMIRERIQHQMSRFVALHSFGRACETPGVRLVRRYRAINPVSLDA